VKRQVLAAYLSALALSACSSDSFVRVTESMLFPNVEPTFEVNAVRPIWTCDRSPDPRYPCVGIGPEGFARDLVAKPFANKRVMEIRDVDRKVRYGIRFTWYSMTGSCGGNIWDEKQEAFISPVRLEQGRTFYEIWGREAGLTRLSAEKIFEAEKATGKKITPRMKSDGSVVTEPFFPPNTQCDADYMDQSAGSPFNVGLWVYAAEPTDATLSQSKTRPSSKGQYKTGCREEVRNEVSWRICSTRARADLPGGPQGSREVQIENWVARLSDSGFTMIVRASYAEPLFDWPQWYAERQASLLEMIDSVRLERTELP
jgi:hypothetical protein